jgi:ubiquinone/menaquinone biosynthesis C-methylase UbiE
MRLAMEHGVSNVVGFSGAEQEASALRQNGLDVRQAYSHSLPLPDHYASVVVCNGVLHIVRPEDIPASLREIARISGEGARIWIGELPRFREPASLREFSGYSAMLWWLLRKRGLRSFLGMCRCVVTGEQKEPNLRTAQAFWSEPDMFAEMASQAGLSVEKHFPHQTLDDNRRPSASPTRHDYVLRAGTGRGLR